MKKRLLIRKGFLIIVVAALAVLAGCGGGGSSTAYSTPAPFTTPAVQEVDCSTATVASAVNIQSFAFAPASASISAGGIVKWTNNDPTTHTVTGGTPGNPGGNFDVSLAPAASKCLKFTVAGAFSYYCKIHTTMTGQVVAQ